jgi:hypothetical protein
MLKVKGLLREWGEIRFTKRHNELKVECKGIGSTRLARGSEGRRRREGAACGNGVGFLPLGLLLLVALLSFEFYFYPSTVQ